MGLRHILLSEDSSLTGSYAPVRLERAAANAPTPPPPRPRPQPSPSVFPRRGATDTAPPRAHSPRPAHTGPPATEAASHKPAVPDWTSIWRRYRAKLTVPSRTLWTYFELGQDMGDSPDDERRALFRRIMQALGWPSGSIGFWPVAYQCRGNLEPRRELFLRGMREAGAHTAVCFGAAAHAILFDDRPYRLETTTLGEATVIVLPGPEDMLGPDAAQAKRIVWERLKAYVPD